MDDLPRLDFSNEGGKPRVVAQGTWRVHTLSLPGVLDLLGAEVTSHRRMAPGLSWDLSQVLAMDHLGAQFFWNAWDKSRPANLVLGKRQEEFFDRLFHLGNASVPVTPKRRLEWIRSLGELELQIYGHLVGFVAIIGQLVLDLGTLIAHPRKGPWLEISANIFRAGAQAVGITALVGFLIGVVLSYLSSEQLRAFGADVYLVNLLGMAIIRELGPVLAAILVAGRSGSAITAQIGVMRVTEELDAMLVMGIPHGFRLVLPKVIALAIAMPLLVLWTDVVSLFGGMVAGKASLGLSFSYFLHALPDAVPLANLWLGVGKGVVFGILIGLTACYFGLQIEPNTSSLGEGTTSSVVSSITIVILADAIFAVLFKDVGY